eukprot:5118452-Alexandrium_andersonii.AAC.1
MWDFGGTSTNGTWLFSNRAWVSEITHYKIERHPNEKPEKLTRVYVDKHGKKRFHGNKLMKASQEYPAQFGYGIASLFEAHADALREESLAEARAIESFARSQDGGEVALE